ncbi:MAG: hypothetical protein ACE5I8_10440 [Thermodesulfobacteriota bacterium]
MKWKTRIVLMSVFLLLVSMRAGAADYKSWISLLPDTLGGMARSGKPDGMNMEMNNQKWSTLNQKYSADNGEKSVDLTIVGGKNAPPLASFQMMSSMKMETEDQIIRTIKVQDYRGLSNLKKDEKSGTLMISLSEEMLVLIDAKPITSEAELLKLAEQLPLAKFAAQAK